MWRLFYLFFGLVAGARAEYFVFEQDGVRYGVVSAAPATVRLHWQDGRGQPYRTLGQLRRALEPDWDIEMLMNAGIFDKQHRPAGLWIENGRELRPLNRQRGRGNFHIQPNGVFFIDRRGRARIVPSERWRPGQEALWAVQSGPLLLSDGKINRRFRAQGGSAYRRNGVCTDAQGRLYFVMTIGARTRYPNLYQFSAALASLGCRQALYLDGSLSSWYVAGRHDDWHLRPRVGFISVARARH